MSSQPPAPGQPPVPEPGAIRCPRCSAPIGPDQDWCLECGAPARTRLAQTPNWRLPTVAIGAVVLIAGALLAFAFVKLTNDNNGTPAATTATAPVVDTTPASAVPPVAAPVPAAVPTTATTTPTAPATGTVPATVPGQTTPATTPTVAPPPPPATSTPSGQTVPANTITNPAVGPKNTTTTP